MSANGGGGASGSGSGACPACGAAAVAGALLCGACGAVVGSGGGGAGVLVFGGASAAVGSAGSASAGSGLALVEQGAVNARKVVELPRGDFEWLIGRHDLAAAPPVVVDLDLTAYCAPVDGANGERGYAVSRRHARLVRVGGRLLVTATSDGGTLVRKAGGKPFERLSGGSSEVLEVGARVLFGAQGPVIFEVV